MSHPVDEEGSIHGGQLFMIFLKIVGTDTILLLQLTGQVE